jgi:subtilisin family serine protease
MKVRRKSATAFIKHGFLLVGVALLILATAFAPAGAAATRGGVTTTSLASPGYIDPPLSIPVDQVPPRETGQGYYGGLTADELWYHVQGSGNQAIVGLKAPGTTRGVWEATRLVARRQVDSTVAELAATPGVVLTFVDPLLPYAVITLNDRAAFDTVRQRPDIDYLDPRAIDMQPQQFGCTDYFPTWAPELDVLGDVLPRTFRPNGIDGAWRRGADGSGVTVGVVDTGLFRDQPEFQLPTFATGASTGRTLTYEDCDTQECLNALPAWAFATCNHGPRITGTIAAPRNGSSTVGVAYRSNLRAVKVGDSVWVEGIDSFIHGFGIMRVHSAGAQVIEMAFGGTFYSDFLADVIRFEYHRNDLPPALFVGAAGTTLCPFWSPVAFPARLPEVLAVTGVNADGSLADGVCTGPEVDLAAVLQDFEVPGSTPGSLITLGGSSGASALVSGIAALVWSKYPWLSRDELKDRLVSTAWWSPYLSNTPVVNAYLATGGIRAAQIASSAAEVAPDQVYTLTVNVIGDGPFTFLWNNGETTQQVSRVGPGTSDVLVTDLTDNNQVRVSRNIPAVPSSPDPVDPTSKVCQKKPWTPGC